MGLCLFHTVRLLVYGILALVVTAYTTLSDETLKSLPSAGTDFDIKTGSILAPILIPRVPGTPGSAAVQQHFIEWFSTHLPKWTIEFQNSTATTPATGDKQIPFVNIIITRDPPWTQPGNVGRLALVAHFDSKLTPAGFIGATDSAAPCAIIMHAARSVDEALTAKWATMEADGSSGLDEEKGVQILLLDGEEAFVSWTDTDSLYGARSLAETWDDSYHAAMSTYKNALDSISLFLLLDLLGAENPTIPSYFKTTHWAYQSLATIEGRLRTLNLQQSKADRPFLPESNKDSNNFRGAWGVQDDHIPFMARGVEVLHMIPTPFPRVWHQMTDDGEHLDLSTVEDWARMVTAFIGEWMDLEGYFPSKTLAEAHIKAKRKVSSKTEL
ncbi:Glutaminyl cyclase [Hyphodiscus hymeniophilus]|uniref:Peptide hydrolase n=1 Tax=Hyphodiscus hymeniophilus TaxID=353542 RepID=A0A9P6SPL9_9HELO|nr:Glutaminyl cyclase [Hyphodiscus hymeniophilus]